MNTSFQNQVAFVTGAAGGIGFATVRAFAEAGAAVAIADVSGDAAKAAAGTAALHTTLWPRRPVAEPLQGV